MSATSIPAAVESLITDSISSVEQLETLLWLRSLGEKGVSVEDLARKLRSSQSSIDLTLQSLASNGLVRECEPGLFCYVRESKERDSVVEELELLYKTRRTSIIRTIYNKP